MTLGDTSNERDNAVAIAIGVTLLILVVVIVVVIVVMAYRKKLFGAVKRNSKYYAYHMRVYKKVHTYMVPEVQPHAMTSNRHHSHVSSMISVPLYMYG